MRSAQAAINLLGSSRTSERAAATAPLTKCRQPGSPTASKP